MCIWQCPARKMELLARKYPAMDFQATKLNKNGGYDGGTSPSMWQRVKLEDGGVWAGVEMATSDVFCEL